MELRERIANHLFQNGYLLEGTSLKWNQLTPGEQEEWLDEVDVILALVRDAGYVRLAENQDSPDLPDWEDAKLLNAYLQGQDEMFAAVFRKVELEGA